MIRGIIKSGFWKYKNNDFSNFCICVKVKDINDDKIKIIIADEIGNIKWYFDYDYFIQNECKYYTEIGKYKNVNLNKLLEEFNKLNKEKLELILSE